MSDKDIEVKSDEDIEVKDFFWFIKDFFTDPIFLCITIFIVLFVILNVWAISFGKKLVVVRESKLITYTVAAVDVYKYRNGSVHFYVYLNNNEENKITTMDNYELYSKLKNHIGQKIQLEYKVVYKKHPEKEKKYFSKVFLVEPVNLQYLEDGISKENESIRTIEDNNTVIIPMRMGK